MRIFDSPTDKAVGIIIAIFLGLLAFVMVVPLLKVAATSFSSAWAADAGQVLFWPVETTLDTWKQILTRSSLWRSLWVTASTTVIGTVLGLLFTALLAYPLSKKEFKPARIMMLLIVITMIFRVPTIPFFLSVRSYGLIDTYWVLIFPHLLTAFNIIIMRTFFMQFPKELEEAAQLEGCGYFRTLFKIVLPTSTAVLATIGIFTAVMIWNQFQTPLLFIRDQDLYPLQIKLREFITSSDDVGIGDLEAVRNYNATTLRAASIIFAVIPIILVYPFLQKYFIKGAFLGSVK